MLSFLLSLFSFSNINNTLFIQNHNAKNLSYQVEENQFINQNYINEFSPTTSHLIMNNLTDNLIQFNEKESIPFHKDWRNKYKVSSVKNQLKCGACWAFSSSEAVESAWAIKYNQLYNLSQQELIDCSTTYGNQGCHGGSMNAAFQYIIENGLCTNLSYPYIASEQSCQQSNCKSIVNITEYQNIMPNSEKILQKATYQQPVSVAIQANKRSFQLYKSGIYSDLNCGTQLDHGVLVIGYGYDPNYNMKYWIIKNSWGTNWGENGYIRIQKDIENEKGLCGIAMQPSIPII